MVNCKECKKEFEISDYKNYCSKECRYAFFTLVGESNKGKRTGKDNPNYEGKSIKDPDTYKKFRDSVKKRGQSWTDKHKKEHSLKQLGDKNSFFNRKHSDSTKEQISKIKKKQFEEGLIDIKRIKISKAEIEIAEQLEKQNINFLTQFSIKGVSYIYDFYFPSLNIILEYNGDFWHANPEKYLATDKIKFPRSKEYLVSDIWKRDLIKKEAIEKYNYKVVYLWENEYKKMGFESVLEKINI